MRYIPCRHATQAQSKFVWYGVNQRNEVEWNVFNLIIIRCRYWGKITGIGLWYDRNQELKLYTLSWSVCDSLTNRWFPCTFVDILYKWMSFQFSNHFSRHLKLLDRGYSRATVVWIINIKHTKDFCDGFSLVLFAVCHYKNIDKAC